MARARRGDRHDAARVDLGRGFKAIFPYLMRGRNESIAYLPLRVDVEPLLAYLERVKGTDKEISIFEALLVATVRILRERPTLNRYIIGRRMYQRHDVTMTFMARREYTLDGSETNVMVRVRPGDDRAAMLAQLRGEIKVAKSGEQKSEEGLIDLFMRLPRSLLRVAVWALRAWDFHVDAPKFLRGVDPLRCSVYLANLGSVGLGASYHHLFEWGTCSMFIAIGKIEPTVVVGADGEPAVRRCVDLAIALDERIADVYYDARALDLFHAYLGNPVQLERI